MTPIAIAVLSFTTSPNLMEPLLLSLTKITGTFLEDAMLGICFVSDRGLQSNAKRIACNNNQKYVPNNLVIYETEFFRIKTKDRLQTWSGTNTALR